MPAFLRALLRSGQIDAQDVMFRGEMVQSVSVVIPARDAAATIGRAIESVLAQTLRPVEIIVVDDGSADYTAIIARSYPAVKVLSHRAVCGAAAARNTGLRASQGEWIAFLDADDEWLPDKLSLQVARIGAEANQSVIFCASEEFTPDGRSLGDTFRDHPVDCTACAWKTLLKENFVATPTVLARRALLLELGGFDEKLPVGEDQDLWIRLALAGRLTYVPDWLVRVHVRPQSLSAFRPADQSRYVLPMVEKHLHQLRHRLTSSEVRGIRGERLRNAARIAFAHGHFSQGTVFVLRSILIGYRPFSGLLEIAKALAAGLFHRLLHSIAERQPTSQGMHRA